MIKVLQQMMLRKTVDYNFSILLVTRRCIPVLFAPVLLVLALLFSASISTNASAEVIQLDRVVAIVDDGIILQSELDERLRNVTERIRSQNTPLPSLQLLQERILDQLVLESIQLQMAERAGIRVSDSELNQTMQKIASQNGMELAEFEQQLAAEGFTYQAAREQIEREMIITRFQQRMVDVRVRVTEKEVNDFLSSAAARATDKASYRLSHILLPYAEGDEQAARQALTKAEELVGQVREGRSFAELAISHSQSSTALQGGDLGWRDANELPTLFVDVVPQLASGEVAEPIVTPTAVHLVQLADVKGRASNVVQQARVRHILVRLNELRDEEASKKLITDIHRRIMEGEDFAELAVAYSDDTVSGSAGGVLDWVSPGQMVPPFEETMNNTAVGDLSDPFKTQFGWHILQVMERRSQDIGDLLQASQARQILHRRRYEVELQNWLGEIRDESYVEIKI